MQGTWYVTGNYHPRTCSTIAKPKSEADALQIPSISFNLYLEMSGVPWSTEDVQPHTWPIAYFLVRSAAGSPHERPR